MSIMEEEPGGAAASWGVGRKALSPKEGAVGRGGWRLRADGHPPRGLCQPHSCLLGVAHPPDSVRCSFCWPQDPSRRVDTGAPAPSCTAQR